MKQLVALGSADVGSAQHLQRDPALQSIVLGEIDLAHAALAEPILARPDPSS